MNGWTTGGMDQPFTRRSGGTPDVGTGPSAAAMGSYYVYAETSTQYQMDFDLQKSFPAGQELYGIAFQYHMYGATMGSAVLESSADGTSWASLWGQSGNLGDQWNHATVYAGSGQTMLRFVYTSGSSDTGDFALDDIRIGHCLIVGCVASNDCFCDRAIGHCLTVPNADGTACDDGNPQTTNDVCDSGLCRACPGTTDDCEIGGTFDQLIQQCSPTTAKLNGTACDDGNPQSFYDVCRSGQCMGTVTVATDSELQSAVAAGYDIEVIADIALSSTITLNGINIHIWSTKPGRAWFSGGNSRQLFNIVGGSTIKFSGIGFRDGYMEAYYAYTATSVGGGCMKIDGSDVDIMDAAFSNCRAVKKLSCVSTDASGGVQT